MDPLLVARLAAIAALLFFSGVLSGSEAALFSLGPVKTRGLEKEGGVAGVRVARLLRNPRQLIVTLLIGNELVNISTSITISSVFRHLTGPRSVAVAIVVSTLLILAFGEVIPKTFAVKGPERFSRRVSGPLTLFGHIVSPVARLLSRVAGGVLRLVGMGTPPQGPIATEKEFRKLVDIGESEGVLELEEREMIHRVFEFGDTDVSEVMTPRTDMFAVDVSTPVIKLVDSVREKIHSRVPVYEERLDNVIGILFVKELIHRFRTQGESFELRELLQPPYLVPETKGVLELLQVFRRGGIHMAIVMDEYGGVSGLVTMEDLLEELVGEIADEFDTDRVAAFHDLGGGRYRVAAMLPLEEFAERVGYAPQGVEIDTLGGYVFHLFGRLPTRGEMVSDEEFLYRVEVMKGPRIVEVLVVRRRKN